MRHSQFLLFPLLLAAVSLLLFSQSVYAGEPVISTPVDKAIHFVRHTATKASSSRAYGSKESLLRGSIVLFDKSVALSAYRHTTVFLPADRHISSSQLESLFALPVRGIVASTRIFDTHNENVLQHFLSRMEIPFPVYFLSEDSAEAGDLYQTLSNHPPHTYAVVSIGRDVMTVAPVANNSLSGIHLYASLTIRPKKEISAAAHVPRLLVTAGFDTLGVAPSARSGSGTTAAAAALELWRRFNAEAMTDSLSSDGPYGVSVLLGNTARFNYASTGRWVGMQQNVELDKALLVICLDELVSMDFLAKADDEEGAENGLFMHVHDSFAKSPQFAEVKAKAEEAAARNGVELTVLSAKTNYDHYDIGFEHQIFAHRQIHAVTFSAVRAHRVDQLFRGGSSLFAERATHAKNDSRNASALNAVADLLERRVNFVYTFAQALLGRTSEDSWIGSASYMSGLMHFASVSDRNPLSNGGVNQVKYAETLVNHMKQRVAPLRRGIVTDVTLTTYRYSPQGVQLFGPYEQIMRIFLVRPMWIEFVILCTILLVVGVFSIVEFGVVKTRKILMNELNDKNEPGS